MFINIKWITRFSMSIFHFSCIDTLYIRFFIHFSLRISIYWFIWTLINGNSYRSPEINSRLVKNKETPIAFPQNYTHLLYLIISTLNPAPFPWLSCHYALGIQWELWNTAISSLVSRGSSRPGWLPIAIYCRLSESGFGRARTLSKDPEGGWRLQGGIPVVRPCKYWDLNMVFSFWKILCFNMHIFRYCKLSWIRDNLLILLLLNGITQKIVPAKAFDTTQCLLHLQCPI